MSKIMLLESNWWQLDAECFTLAEKKKFACPFDLLYGHAYF